MGRWIEPSKASDEILLSKVKDLSQTVIARLQSSAPLQHQHITYDGFVHQLATNDRFVHRLFELLIKETASRSAKSATEKQRTQQQEQQPQQEEDEPDEAVDHHQDEEDAEAANRRRMTESTATMARLLSR